VDASLCRPDVIEERGQNAMPINEHFGELIGHSKVNLHRFALGARRDGARTLDPFDCSGFYAGSWGGTCPPPNLNPLEPFSGRRSSRPSLGALPLVSKPVLDVGHWSASVEAARANTSSAA
jgi:hypothetical protein